MFEVGRLAVKIAGRDAGKVCVIVDVLEGNRVLVDGETRRKKVNPKHLEPLGQLVKLSKGASHDDVKKALKPLDIETQDTKPKSAAERPKKQKVNKKELAKDDPKAKKESKKEAKKETKKEEKASKESKSKK
tara:strand:- start:6562 stop:6957 length:396 start_codon:yes stop_codon:yes gene_type:complete